MSHVLFLAENLFNVVQFPGHTLTGQGNGAEDAFRIGSSRRGQTSALATTGGVLFTVTTDRVRSADTLILDRQTVTSGLVNLAVSSDLLLQETDDIIDLPYPSQVVAGSSIDGPLQGIRTEEGAAIFHFPERSGLVWRLWFKDTAIVGGCYLGKSYRPTYPRMPFDEASRWMTSGTARRGVPDNDIRTGRSAMVSMMMRDEQEWDTARWTLRQLFGRGHPMWFIHAPNTERAWFAHNVDGSVSAPFAERPQGRSVTVALEEYDPALP